MVCRRVRLKSPRIPNRRGLRTRPGPETRRSTATTRWSPSGKKDGDRRFGRSGVPGKGVHGGRCSLCRILGGGCGADRNYPFGTCRRLKGRPRLSPFGVNPRGTSEVRSSSPAPRVRRKDGTCPGVLYLPRLTWCSESEVDPYSSSGPGYRSLSYTWFLRGPGGGSRWCG